MGAYFRRTSESLTYLRSVFPSVWVHDALGYFDPTSTSVDTTVFDVIPQSMRLNFLHTIARTRARIRAYLSWDEGCDGGWRFYGRAGGVAPHADTTACAAAALLDVRRNAVAGHWARHVESLARLAPTPFSTGDLVAETNVLRFLALVGEPVRDRIDAVLAAVGEGAADPRREPHRWLGAYSVVKAWTSAHLPRRDELRAKLLPMVLEGASQGFGGPLSTAMGLSLLLDLGHTGPEVNRTQAALLATRSETGVFPTKLFCATAEARRCAPRRWRWPRWPAPPSTRNGRYERESVD